MARYRGPRLKKCRAVGTVLPGLTTRATLDRPFPPGEHGAKRRRKFLRAMGVDRVNRRLPAPSSERVVAKRSLRLHSREACLLGL